MTLEKGPTAGSTMYCQMTSTQELWWGRVSYRSGAIALSWGSLQPGEGGEGGKRGGGWGKSVVV